MRKVFVETLCGLARRDPRVLLLTGDLGYLALEPFAAEFPGRFFNCGVAEQNMVGVATGLAEAGYIPYVYSIATFSALRPYDFIRNGPALHKLPVRIVGVGGGFEYGHNGITHYALEDYAVMRAQPAVTVIAPADLAQARAALEETWQTPGPVYYRLGKNEAPPVPGLEGRFGGGLARLTPPAGEDLLLLAAGAVSAEAAAAAELLRAAGSPCALAVLARLNPAPEEELAGLLAGFRLVMTVESHYVNGGLGSLAAEIIASRGLGCRLRRRAVEAMPAGFSGSEAHLNRLSGLDAASLAAAAGRLRAEGGAK
jgi:transketolase